MSYNNLPEEVRPLSPWEYFVLFIIYDIPVIGIIVLICHAVGASNVNKRNFARSFFCVFVIVAIILAIMLLTGSLASFIGGIGA